MLRLRSPRVSHQKNLLMRAGVLGLCGLGFALWGFTGTGLDPHACHAADNQVCADIVTLKPKINKDFALLISNHFVQIAQAYSLPVQLLISIAKQESDFRLETIRWVRGLVKQNNGSFSEGTVGSDFCMMQINAANITRMKLDANRLVSDARYCIEAGAKILSESRVHMAKEPTWWTRYNASSAIHRKIYHEHVIKHWRKLDPHMKSRLCTGGKPC